MSHHGSISMPPMLTSCLFQRKQRSREAVEDMEGQEFSLSRFSKIALMLMFILSAGSMTTSLKIFLKPTFQPECSGLHQGKKIKYKYNEKIL